jgi:hypothetical protein
MKAQKAKQTQKQKKVRWEGPIRTEELMQPHPQGESDRLWFDEHPDRRRRLRPVADGEGTGPRKFLLVLGDDEQREPRFVALVVKMDVVIDDELIEGASALRYFYVEWRLGDDAVTEVADDDEFLKELVRACLAVDQADDVDTREEADAILAEAMREGAEAA